MSRLVLENVSELFQSSQFSDFLITCKDRTWHVHRNIICPRSTWFSACYTKFREGVDRKVDLPDDDPDVVDAALSYLYKGEYCDTDYSQSIPALVLHVNVQVLAFKYDVTGLADAAQAFFLKRLDHDWQSSAFVQVIRQLWDEHGCELTKVRLGPLVVQTAACHASELYTMKAEEDIDAKYDSLDFSQVASEVPAFASQLCQSVLNLKACSQPSDTDSYVTYVPPEKPIWGDWPH